MNRRISPVVLVLSMLFVALVIWGCGATATPTAAPPAAAATKAPEPTKAPEATKPPAAAATTAPAAAAATKPAAPAAGSPVSGGTLKLILCTSCDLNPIGVRTTGYDYGMSISYDGLVQTSADWEKVEGNLAESWDISPDGLKYVFHLRKGVQWHDGKPFTAADVEFTYKTFLTKAVASRFAQEMQILKGAQDFYDGKSDKIEGLKVVDDNTIEFNLIKPNAALLFQVMTLHVIIPKHVWEKTSPTDLSSPATWEKSQIGTGPFKFSKYEADKFLEFVRYDNYWKGKPYLDKILFVRVGTTSDAGAVALEKGDVDYATLPATEMARMGKIANLTVGTKAIYNVRFFAVNNAKPYLKDKRVRQALAYGIDRVGLCAAILLGVCDPTNSLAPSKFWYNTNLPKYEYNVDKAKQLLKDAGWDANTELDVSFYYNDQLSKDYMAAVQQQLAKIGIKSKITQLDGPAVQGYYYEDKKFDIMYAGFGVSPDMAEFGTQFISTAGWPAGANATSYNNAKVDQLFADGIKTADPAARKKVYDELQVILSDELPWLPLHLLKISYGFTKRVMNGDPIARNWNRPYNWVIEKVWLSDGK